MVRACPDILKGQGRLNRMGAYEFYPENGKRIRQNSKEKNYLCSFQQYKVLKLCVKLQNFRIITKGSLFLYF